MHFWLIFLTNHRLVTGFIRLDQSKLNEDIILVVLYDYLCVVIVLNSSWLLHTREYWCWESRTGSWASAFLQCFQINCTKILSVSCTATESKELFNLRCESEWTLMLGHFDLDRVFFFLKMLVNVITSDWNLLTLLTQGKTTLYPISFELFRDFSHLVTHLVFPGQKGSAYNNCL